MDERKRKPNKHEKAEWAQMKTERAQMTANEHE